MFYHYQLFHFIWNRFEFFSGKKYESIIYLAHIQLSLLKPLTGIQDCTKFGFACLDGSCVDMNAVCDGNVDCADGADELQCGELRMQLAFISDICFVL